MPFVSRYDAQRETQCSRMHLLTQQGVSEAVDVCNLMSYLHQPSQAEHKAQHTSQEHGHLNPLEWSWL